jgi:antitoxin PrlF
MTAATLTSKGQITLPKAVRQRLGVGAGDRVEFIEADGGFLVVPAMRDIRSLKGMVPRPRRAVSIERMNETIAQMGQSKSPHGRSAG